MNTEKRIALACFIGAVIGALLALQFNHYFWWAGILLGGITGYLSYEFKAVMWAVKSVSGIVWREMTQQKYNIPAIPFDKIKTVGKLVVSILFVLVPCCFTLVIALLIVASWAIVIFFLDLFPEDLGVLSNAGLTLVCLLPGFAFISYVCQVFHETESNPSMIKSAIKEFIWLNGLVVLCFVIPRGLLWLTMRIPPAVTFLIRVAKRTFILIHSEIRLLCMTDAMLGALVGYFCGNALVGGVAGAVLGVVNYKLVSVRWLKLVRA